MAENVGSNLMRPNLVLVYWETIRENTRNKAHRAFRLAKDYVKEKL